MKYPVIYFPISYYGLCFHLVELSASERVPCTYIVHNSEQQCRSHHEVRHKSFNFISILILIIQHIHPSPPRYVCIYHHHPNPHSCIHSFLFISIHPVSSQPISPSHIIPNHPANHPIPRPSYKS